MEEQKERMKRLESLRDETIRTLLYDNLTYCRALSVLEAKLATLDDNGAFYILTSVLNKLEFEERCTDGIKKAFDEKYNELLRNRKKYFVPTQENDNDPEYHI